MSCRVKTNRHGYLAFALFWDGQRSWEGTGLEDTAENRKVMEAQATLITREIKKGIFDYLRWFPDGNKAHLFKEIKEAAPTVADYFAVWIERKKPPLVRAALERDYRQQFKRYILPHFGHLRLSDVTPRRLEEFRTRLLHDHGLSLKSCRNIIDATFRAMMRDARTVDYLIDRDPFEALSWPRIRLPKPDPFTERERDLILRYFKTRKPYYHPFVFTLFWTGLRPSEAIALRWSDVDLRRETISITKSRYRGVEAQTKTKGSERTIRLLPTVAEVLRALKPLHLTEDSYVFTNQKGQPVHADQWRKKYWYRALRAQNIRERKFYATRHTYISVALSVGVNIKWLAEQCGTSVAMIERDYGRYIRDDGDAPLRALVRGEPETLPETLGGQAPRNDVQLIENIEEGKWSGRLDLNQDRKK